MSPDAELRLRPASEEDAARLLEWRNDPATRAASRSTAEVEPGEHRAWLAEKLADPECDLLVAELDGEPVGQARFDPLPSGEREISVALAPASRGAGLGAELIRAAAAWLAGQRPGSRILAEVRPENEPSMRSFRAAGFREAPGPATEGFVRLELPPGA